MYISQLKLWNFRKFWSDATEINLEKADLTVNFHNWLNLLVGPNDAGKTAIIDALKIVLKTYSSEWIKLEENDFYNNAKHIRIEIIISDQFKDGDKTAEWASNFTEWLRFDIDGNPELRLILDTHREENWKIKPYDIKAWNDEIGYALTADAKDYLKSVYLKPLRDAENELTPKRGSRLSQILSWTNQFKNQLNSHPFNENFEIFSDFIKKYFEDDGAWYNWISKEINSFLESFWRPGAPIVPTDKIDLKYILELLKLAYNDKKPGLWSQNLLFIATELLHLATCPDDSLKLWLIEEIEAHLNPQIQLKVIETLQKESEDKLFQLILTTHSPNLSSKVKLKNLILCNNWWAFNLWSKETIDNLEDKYTKLMKTDYQFLERFLDVTKSNLFFSRWLILTEGWWEELLLPILAEKLGVMEKQSKDKYNLTKKWVSIINVWNTAYMRYAKIFWRQQPLEDIGIKISVINDLDVQPKDTEGDGEIKRLKKEELINAIWSSNIKPFISPSWTLEYCLATSNVFKKVLIRAIIAAQKEEKLHDYEYWKLKQESITLDNIDYEKFESSPIEIYLQISEGKPISYQENGKTKSLYSSKVSKSILAQNLAKLLEEEDEDFFLELQKEINSSPTHWLKYLFDAIKHACW